VKNELNKDKGNDDRHLAHVIDHEVVADHHHHDVMIGAGNHLSIDHATTAHIAKRTGTMHSWKIVAGLANANVNHRQADLAGTMNTRLHPTSLRGRKPRGYSTGFAVTDAPCQWMLTVRHANARVMTYTPYVNTIRTMQTSNACTGCAINATCSARSKWIKKAANTYHDVSYVQENRVATRY
jgi:hypothetical protein